MANGSMDSGGMCGHFMAPLKLCGVLIPLTLVDLGLVSPPACIFVGASNDPGVFGT